MTRNRLSAITALSFALLLGLGRSTAAQSNVTSADIQRLQDNIYDASRDLPQLRSRDATLASQLQSELDDARDEVTYLKVKLRRNEPISRSEYDDLRNRIENIRARVTGGSSGRSGSYTPSQEPPTNPESSRTNRDYPRDSSRPAGTVGRTSNPNEVPSGTEFDVRLEKTLSSGTAQIEDRFEATTLVDLMNGDRVLVPAGSVMRGVVS